MAQLCATVISVLRGHGLPNLVNHSRDAVMALRNRRFDRHLRRRRPPLSCP